MTEQYTVKQAMDRLGLKRKGTFYLLEKRYPQAFVSMNMGTGTHASYHKATLDRFAMIRAYFMNGNSQK